MHVIEYVFWGSLAIVTCAALVYPALVWLLSRFIGDATATAASAGNGSRNSDNEWPSVSIVIPASGQEKVILDRIQRALSQDYPSDRIEAIVGCDGAEDLTGDLVLTFDDSRVRLVQSSERRGRAATLNDCVDHADGEVLVICDASAVMQQDLVRRLVRHFRRPQVGGVCGSLTLTDPTTGQVADSVFRRFENMLARCEARFGIPLPSSGAIYAIRKQLYRPLPNDTVTPELFLALRIRRSGMRFLCDETAVAVHEIPATLASGSHRWLKRGAEHLKNLLRTFADALTVGKRRSCMWKQSTSASSTDPRESQVSAVRAGRRHILVNVLGDGLACVFLSHKLLCWCCPVLLVTALLTNAVLSIDPFYLRVLLLHELVYLAAFTTLCFTQTGRRQSVSTWTKSPDDADSGMRTEAMPRGRDDSWPTAVQAVGSGK